MASKKTKGETEFANTRDTGQGVKNGLVCCMDCLHAWLHRYGGDPVLAACHCKPNEHNERFPYQVEVARFMRHCSLYKRDMKPKEIEQREKAA